MMVLSLGQARVIEEMQLDPGRGYTAQELKTYATILNALAEKGYVVADKVPPGSNVKTMRSWLKWRLTEKGRQVDAYD